MGARRSLLPDLLISGWVVAVSAVFLASAGSLVAPTGRFFCVASLLAGTAYLALLAGFRILRRLERFLPAGADGWDPLERTAVEFGLGVGVLIAGVFLMGILGLYHRAAALVFLGALGIGPHRSLLRELRARCGGLRFRSGAAVPIIALGLVGGMTLLESFAPATAQDALAYHLAVPAKYIESGGIRYIPESFFAQFPENVEMLFTLALLLWGSPLASGYHWMLGAGSALAVAALARRISAAGAERDGGAPRGLLAAAIFASIPTAALIAGWAYVDLGLVLFQVLSTLAFLRWWECGRAPGSPRAGWLVLSGVFAGFAAGCKYTGGAQGIAIALAALVEAVLRRKDLRRGLSSAAIASAAAGLIASPWWVKNLINTGNPLFPFLYGLLGGRDWDAERAATLSAFLQGWGREDGGLLDLLLLPWRLTMSARFFSMERFDGMIGPVFLIGLPLVLWALWKGLRRPAGTPPGGAEEPGELSLFRWAALFALSHAALWLILSRQIRFLLPALAPGAALIEASLGMALPKGSWKHLTAGAVRLGLAFNTVLIATHFAAHNPLPVVLGYEPEEAYLQREVPCGDYAVFRFIERELPSEGVSILFGATGNPGFLCKRPYRADSIFENHTLASILRSGGSPERIREEMRRRGFTHLLFRWDLVFDASERRSGIPLESQKDLMEYLNRHGKLLFQAGGTFLYRLDAPREPPRQEAMAELPRG